MCYAVNQSSWVFAKPWCCGDIIPMPVFCTFALLYCYLPQSIWKFWSSKLARMAHSALEHKSCTSWWLALGSHVTVVVSHSICNTLSPVGDACCRLSVPYLCYLTKTVFQFSICSPPEAVLLVMMSKSSVVALLFICCLTSLSYMTRIKIQKNCIDLDCHQE